MNFDLHDTQIKVAPIFLDLEKFFHIVVGERKIKYLKLLMQING
jgi:hypothetical protein